MTAKSLSTWTAANAIGLGVGFVAFVQTVMVIGYGSLEWQPEPPAPAGAGPRQPLEHESPGG